MLDLVRLDLGEDVRERDQRSEDHHRDEHYDQKPDSQFVAFAHADTKGCLFSLDLQVFGILHDLVDIVKTEPMMK